MRTSPKQCVRRGVGASHDPAPFAAFSATTWVPQSEMQCSGSQSYNWEGGPVSPYKTRESHVLLGSQAPSLGSLSILTQRMAVSTQTQRMEVSTRCLLGQDFVAALKEHERSDGAQSGYPKAGVLVTRMLQEAIPFQVGNQKDTKHILGGALLWHTNDFSF